MKCWKRRLDNCEGACILLINMLHKSWAYSRLNQGFPSSIRVSTTLELEDIYHGFKPNLDIRNIKKDT